MFKDEELKLMLEQIKVFNTANLPCFSIFAEVLNTDMVEYMQGGTRAR